MDLIFISLAPVVIIAFYIYFRDRYEREPLLILFSALVVGAVTVLPITYVERFLQSYGVYFSGRGNAFFTAFVVAGFSEELFKYAALMLLIWNNKNFNEKFDGVVYAVFISLGFATVENLMYVFGYGYDVGVSRAFTAIPAHSLFAISMGYFLGIAKFYPQKRSIYLVLGLVVPIALHGMYDFILMANFQHYLFLFIPFMIGLVLLGFRLMKVLSRASVFRNDGFGGQDSNMLGM